YAQDGIRFFYDPRDPNATIMSDTNGNYLKVYKSQISSVTQYTDTLGRVVATVTPFTDHYDYQVTDANGAAQKYKLNLQSFNIRTNFACSNVAEYTPGYPQQLPVSLVLPNGQS